MKRAVLLLPSVALSPFRKRWAPQPRQPGQYQGRVTIIGAGLAGLAAAYELRKAGLDVTVLEARKRAGGRVYSLREPFSDDLFAEAGAVFIPNTHTLTLGFCKSFNLELYHLKPTDLRRIYFFAGKRFEATIEHDPAWPLELTADERALGFFGMQLEYLAPIFDALGDPTDPSWPPEHLKPYDEIGFASFLQQQGASPGAIQLLRMGFNDTWGDGIEGVSALFMLRAIAAQMEAFELYTIQGGNDRLPQAFASHLQDIIRYEAPVVRLEQDDQGVRTIFQQQDGYHTLDADYLICTAPFSTLRTIDTTTALVPEKRQVIQELPYTSVLKTFLQFREKAWREGPAAWSATDDPLMNINDATLSQTGQRGILGSFTTGLEARKAMQLDEGERIQMTLSYMNRLFPGIASYYERGTSVCWDQDPWAQGGYCHFAPGQLTAFSSLLAHPDRRIHFAGEHTSVWNGWMQGGLESGLRAANEIMSRL